MMKAVHLDRHYPMVSVWELCNLIQNSDLGWDRVYKYNPYDLGYTQSMENRGLDHCYRMRPV